MHPQHSPGGSTAPVSRGDHDPQEIYELEQRGLLDLLLEEFPGLLTYREALTARVDDPEDFGETDRFGNAARGLIASGLVIRQGRADHPEPARPRDGRPRLQPRLMDEVTRRVAERVGRRIRRPRRDQELSQEAVAYRAEIHRTQISLIEHGERLPRIDTLIKIAGAIGVSPCELLDGLAWEPGDRRPGRLIEPDQDCVR